MKSTTKLDEQSIHRIIQHFDTEERLVPFSAMEVQSALSLENSVMLTARLERAAINQLSGGEATVSRYAIWAETIRGILIDATNTLSTSVEHSSIKLNLTKAANSLAAFSTIQSRFDPFRQ